MSAPREERWGWLMLVGCILIAIILVLVPVFDRNGLTQWLRLARQEEQLKQEIHATRTRIEKLQALNRRLQTDVTLIERMAREDYLYARPNELVILITESPNYCEPGQNPGEGEHVKPEGPYPSGTSSQTAAATFAGGSRCNRPRSPAHQ